jgi:glycerol-3-phosphate dehydrogenase subunit C
MEINTAAKAELRKRQLRENPLDLKLWRNTLLGYNEVLGQVGGMVAPLANLMMGLQSVRLLMEKTFGIDHRAPFPKFHFTKFRQWFFSRRVPLQLEDFAGISKVPAKPADRGGTSKPKVAYFHGCATEHYEPEVGKAIVAVLEHNGFEVILPEQNCCGLPMQSNGNFAAARRYALANLRKLAPYAGQGIPIVVGGTSCGLELKSDYRELLGIHTPEAKLVAEHVYDINEFLWLEYEAGRLKTDFRPMTRYIAHHTSCHQKLHRIGRPALDLLRLVPGLTVEEMGADCCGIAGTYGYKHEKYEISQAVGKPLFDRIKTSGADPSTSLRAEAPSTGSGQALKAEGSELALNAVKGQALAICDNETCRWNIAASTSVRVVHTVQVLAEAYGLHHGAFRYDQEKTS